MQWIDEFNTVFRAVNFYDKGVMPIQGGWTEQPAKLMRFIEIVNYERGKHGRNDENSN